MQPLCLSLSISVSLTHTHTETYSANWTPRYYAGRTSSTLSLTTTFVLANTGRETCAYTDTPVRIGGLYKFCPSIKASESFSSKTTRVASETRTSSRHCPAMGRPTCYQISLQPHRLRMGSNPVYAGNLAEAIVIITGEWDCLAHSQYVMVP
jgi:hypothetical protein